MDTIILRNIIPAGLPPDAALFFPPYSIFQSFEVLIGKDPVYHHGRMGPEFSNRHLYLKWHMIPLGSEHNGEYLTLRIYSDHHSQIGLTSPGYIGKPAALLSVYVLRDIDITVLAMLFIIIGMAAAIIRLADDESKNRTLLIFAIVAIFSGSYFLTESRVTQLFVEVSPFLSYLHYVSFFIFISGMAAFIEDSIGPGYLLCIRRIWQFFLFLAAIGTGLDLFSVVPWDITFDLTLWAVLICFVPLSIELVRTSMSGKYSARIICMGFSMVLLFGFIDLIGGLRVVSLENQAVFPWGFLFLLFSFMWVLVHNHRTEREANEQNLHQSYERFRRLFEDAPVPIFQFDMQSSRLLLHRANHQAVYLFGFQKSEFQQMPLQELLLSGHNTIFNQMRERLISGKKFKADGTGRKKDGTKFPIRITASMEQLSGFNQAILILEDLTLERAKRSEEEAVIEERHRIAREIHDGLAQDLAAMNMKAGIWKTIVKRSPDKMLEEIVWFEKRISKNIKDVRRCIFALRPIDLEKFGFKEGLQRLIEDFNSRYNFHILFDHSDLAKVPDHLEPTLFRITQEALNNIAKHAQAKDVRVGLTVSDNGSVILEIEDNGKGFILNTMDLCYRNGHLGLKQIQERVEKEKGRFDIRSSPGKGTRMTVALPLTGRSSSLN